MFKSIEPLAHCIPGTFVDVMAKVSLGMIYGPLVPFYYRLEKNTSRLLQQASIAQHHL